MAKDKKQEKPIEAEEIKEVAEVLPSGPRWVKVTREQLVRLQNEAKLIGYKPETSEALVK